MTRFRGLALVVFAFSLPVLAQGLPALDGVPNPDENLLAAVGLVVQLAQGGQWLPAIMLGLFLAVWAFRKYALKLIPGKVGDWLRTKVGGYVINFVFALLGGIGSLALSGKQATFGLVASLVGAAVSFAFGASGLNELWKDLTVKPAPVEAPKVESIEQAVTEFNKPSNTGMGPPQ